MKTTVDTMQAVALDKFGGPDVLSIQNLPIPEVGTNDVLIKVESAGVGQWDAYERQGGFKEFYEQEPKFPYVLGSDGAGTIEAAGSGVRKFKQGDRVYAMSFLNPKGGFYSEYCCVNEKNCSPIPKNLPTEQAGALAVSGVTALQGLDDTLGLKKNETIMIIGASGGVGHIALQLARAMGARVFAVASGDDGVELCRRLGAESVIEGHSEEIEAATKQFAPGGIDCALVFAGGPNANRALRAMKKGGRVAYPHGVDPEPEVSEGVKLKAYDGVCNEQVLRKLNHLIELGDFEVNIWKSFPLNKVAEAHKAVAQHHCGKIILKP